MILLVAAVCGACLLVGMVFGIWLERAANRKQRGGMVDVTTFGSSVRTRYVPGLTETRSTWTENR